MKELKSESVNLKEKIKAEKDSIIQANYIYIDKLRADINTYKVEIDKAFYSIDSLSNKKERIKIVYIEKYKEIEEFTSTQLNDYWQYEFSN